MNHLIEPQQLKDQLDSPDIIIVDLCNPSLYQQQHVPGAVHHSGQHLIAGVAPVPGACPEISKLATVMAYLGIDDSQKVRKFLPTNSHPWLSSTYYCPIQS